VIFTITPFFWLLGLCLRIPLLIACEALGIAYALACLSLAGVNWGLQRLCESLSAVQTKRRMRYEARG
jgi:hypothetical protein